MTDIFLSYAREDQARVAPLAAALTAAGFDVWWDRRLAGGAEFSKETEEQLNKARVILVAWSRAACESMWVADEATVGRNKGNLVPIVLDGAEPRIGFRQIQTIDFSDWRGGAQEAPAAALIEAVRARLGAASGMKPPAPAKPRRRFYAAAGAAAIAALAAAAFVASKYGAGANAPPTDQAAPAALADDPSLSVLEALAIDLENKGDLRAASSAYTRFAARALLFDRARGLAARKKAFDLDPESVNALQGLIYDTNLYKGGPEAKALGEEILARSQLSPRVRAYGNVLLATLDLDMRGDVASAEGRLATVRSISEAAPDPSIDYAELWLQSVIDSRLGRFDSAVDQAERSERIYATLPPEVPRNGEVQLVVTYFSAGDWEKALSYGAKAIERRRKAGEFLAWPILDVVCRAALFLERPQDDAGACASVSGRGVRDSDARGKMFAVLQAAHEGDFAAARSELAAARAMAGPQEGEVSSFLGFGVQLNFSEAYIAARGGDFAAARRIVHEAMTPASGNEVIRQVELRARAATARLVAAEMLRQGASDDACAEAARAEAYYRQMSAAPGVAAVEAMAREAGC